MLHRILLFAQSLDLESPAAKPEYFTHHAVPVLRSRNGVQNEDSKRFTDGKKEGTAYPRFGSRVYTKRTNTNYIFLVCVMECFKITILVLIRTF